MPGSSENDLLMLTEFSGSSLPSFLSNFFLAGDWLGGGPKIKTKWKIFKNNTCNGQNMRATLFLF